MLNSNTKYLNCRDELTLDELVDMIPGVRHKSEITRKPFFDDYDTGNYLKQNQGRPKKLISSDILKMFPGTKEPNPEQSIKAVVRRTTHEGEPRKPFPGEYKLNIAIEKEVIDLTLQLYLGGSMENGIRICCEASVNEFIIQNEDKYPHEIIAGRQYLDGLPEGFKSIQAMQGFYYKRINDNTKFYTGYKHRDNWVTLFKDKNRVKSSQKEVEKLRYDKLPLLSSFGLIGSGYGAGQMWFIDGTGFDALMVVDDPSGTSKKKSEIKKINMMLIICAITGKVLNAKPIRSESASTMIEFVIDTYKMYGVPKYGMFVDNSSAFTSYEFKGFCKNLYSDEELDGFGGGYDWVSGIFPAHTEKSPLFFPPPNVPTAFIKAYGERMIQEIKKFMPTHIPGAYMASPSKRASTDLVNTLDTLKKHAPLATTGWSEFEEYCYSKYEKRTIFRHKSYSRMAKKLGYDIVRQQPCVRNFWLFFGGNADGTTNEDRSYPKSKEAFLYLHSVPKKWKHRVQNSNSKYLLVTHENIQRNYYLDALSTCHNTRYFIVVPTPDDPKQAFVFIENDHLRKDDRVPEKGDVYLVGIAQDATIRGREDTHWVGKMAASRKRTAKESDEKLNRIEPASWQELSSGKDTCHPKLNADVAALPYEAEETQLRITAPSKDIHDNPDKDIKPEPTIVGIQETNKINPELPETNKVNPELPGTNKVNPELPETEVIEAEVIEEQSDETETVETETEVDIDAMYNDLMGIS
jgi:hypothetical protein